MKYGVTFFANTMYDQFENKTIVSFMDDSKRMPSGKNLHCSFSHCFLTDPEVKQAFALLLLMSGNYHK